MYSVADIFWVKNIFCCLRYLWCVFFTQQQHFSSSSSSSSSSFSFLSELFDYSVRWDGSSSGTQIVLTSYCKNHNIRSIFPRQQQKLRMKESWNPTVCWYGFRVKVYNHCLLFHASPSFPLLQHHLYRYDDNNHISYCFLIHLTLHDSVRGIKVGLYKNARPLFPV